MAPRPVDVRGEQTSRRRSRDHRVLLAVLLPWSVLLPHQPDRHERAQRLRFTRQGRPSGHRRQRVRRTRTNNGGRTAALEIGLFASLIATVIGTLVGAVAGLVGGFLDGLLMRVVDVLLSIPLLFIILIVSAHFNGATVISLSLIIGAFSWLVSARLGRGEVLTL